MRRLSRGTGRFQASLPVSSVRPAVPVSSAARAAVSSIPAARWETVCWALCSGFALLLCSRTDLAPHQVWGACAAVGYGAAAVLAHRASRPWGRLSSAAAVTGSVLVPLLFLVADGSRQMEVEVVERSGALLLDSGSPYVPDPAQLRDYNPYLPAMALFGLPRAVLGAGPLADARLWFAAAFLGAMALAAVVPLGRRGVRGTSCRPGAGGARGGQGRSTGNALLWLAAAPAVALPLAVGGVDLPVIGLMCLALTLAGRGGSGVAAGLALGAAAALKWTAWPLLPVGLALLTVTAGRRAAVRAAATAVTAAALAVLPVALADPRTFTEHLLLFPLGEGRTGSPATSPLPGHLLVRHVPGGFGVAVAALAVSAVVVAVSLVTRPPGTTVAAADRLALGLGLAMCLIPATRFGYVVYPLVLLGWFRLVSAGRRPAPPGSAVPSFTVKKQEG